MATFHPALFPVFIRQGPIQGMSNGGVDARIDGKGEIGRTGYGMRAIPKIGGVLPSVTEAIAKAQVREYRSSRLFSLGGIF